jgi:hypothetical protein
MPISAQSILQRVQTTLQDLQGVRWTAGELVAYLNDGQRDLITARPDQGATTASMATVAGARQTLPANAISLISVTGNTSGTQRAIRKVSMSTLDAANRDWASSTPAAVFVNYMYELSDPRVFWVYPPSAATGGSVDVVYSAMPADIPAPTGTSYTAVTGDIGVPDQWSTALTNYVLGRAYAKDAEYGGNAQLAAAYMGAFASAIGVQLQSSTAVTPK